MSTIHISDEMLQQYVDRKAAAGESSWMAKHIATCARCAAMHSKMVLLDRSLRSSIPVHAPDHLAETVLLHVRTARRFAATARIAVLASAAFVSAAVLAAVGGITWLVMAGRSSVASVSPAQKMVAEWYASWTGSTQSLLGEMSRYTSMVSGSALFPTAVMLVCAIAAIVAIDVLIGRRVVRRVR